MKIAVVCNSDALAIPSIQFLKEQNLLAGVGIAEKSKAVLLHSLQGIGIMPDAVAVFPTDSWKESMKSWLIGLGGVDAVFVIAFPWKIPVKILDIPINGFFNFHFGALPKYKGADPVFWHIRNMEIHGALFIHKMTADIDAGPIVLQKETNIFSGETYTMHCLRVGYEAVSTLKLLLADLEQGALTETVQLGGKSLYEKRPGTADFQIDWKQQSAREIECLVNACNQNYGGASTSLRNRELRLLEVSPVDMGQIPEQKPGTVVHADALHGLVIACKGQQFLKINIVHMQEGYVSGTKLFSMGVGIGEQLI
ncbi:MAG: hypothetical protein EOP54_13030 [Sphingobacteriales bacterium]|nr:MAG: hypothetical protein EOP54_13030 [Sphingobacteriales bacterium]